MDIFMVTNEDLQIKVVVTHCKIISNVIVF